MKRRRIVFMVCLIMGVVIASISYAQLPEKKYMTPDGSMPGGLFAPGVQVGKTLYVSGKGDYRPGEPYDVKVKNCLNECRKVLQTGGMDMENVVKVFIYVQDMDQYPILNEEYAKFFPKNPPARTTLGVPVVPGQSQLEITMIAYDDLKERKVITPEGVKPSTLPFSNGILAGNTLYISGKGDQLADGGHPETFEEQVRQAMRNVGSVLKAAGLGFENVVMSHVYLNNYDNYGIANKVYSEFFEYGNEPARATVFVDRIPGGSHVEITCIATTDLSTRKVVRPAAFKYGPEEMAPTASPAVWAGNTLYISAQSGWEPLEGITTTDLEIQMRRMMQHHTDVLSAAGLGWGNIVSGNVYLRNINDYTQMNAMYRGYFLDGKAVRTTLQNNSGYEKNDIRVRTSFIAAKTKK